jgi:hypothetical protein
LFLLTANLIPTHQSNLPALICTNIKNDTSLIKNNLII